MYFPQQGPTPSNKATPPKSTTPYELKQANYIQTTTTTITKQSSSPSLSPSPPSLPPPVPPLPSLPSPLFFHHHTNKKCIWIGFYWKEYHLVFYITFSANYSIWHLARPVICRLPGRPHFMESGFHSDRSQEVISGS